MDVIVAIILMGLFSIAAGDPPSGQGYDLCSQFYFMNQHCTSQPRQTSNAESPRHVRPLMRGKAGPQGPPGIVNKTEINETITGRFSEWEVKMEEKFTALKNFTTEEVKVMKNGVEIRTKEYATSMEENFSKWKNLTELTADEMKENLTNKGKDLEEGVERKFTRWRREADSEVEQMKEEIDSKKYEWQELKDQLDEMKGSLAFEMNKASSFIANRTREYATSMEESFSKWKNLTELTADEMKENLTNKGKDLEGGIERKFTSWSRVADSEVEQMKEEIDSKKYEWQVLKDQLDEMKGSLNSKMNWASSFITTRTRGRTCFVHISGWDDKQMISGRED